MLSSQLKKEWLSKQDANDSVSGIYTSDDRTAETPVEAISGARINLGCDPSPGPSFRPTLPARVPMNHHFNDASASEQSAYDSGSLDDHSLIRNVDVDKALGINDEGFDVERSDAGGPEVITPVTRPSGRDENAMSSRDGLNTQENGEEARGADNSQDANNYCIPGGLTEALKIMGGMGPSKRPSSAPSTPDPVIRTTDMEEAQPLIMPSPIAPQASYEDGDEQESSSPLDGTDRYFDTVNSKATESSKLEYSVDTEQSSNPLKLLVSVGSNIEMSEASVSTFQAGYNVPTEVDEPPSPVSLPSSTGSPEIDFGGEDSSSGIKRLQKQKAPSKTRGICRLECLIFLSILFLLSGGVIAIVSAFFLKEEGSENSVSAVSEERAVGRPSSGGSTPSPPSSSPTRQPSENQDETSDDSDSEATSEPSKSPSSQSPTAQPTSSPSFAPSESPTMQPSKVPSVVPTATPSTSPSSAPTAYPSNAPTSSTAPSMTPTQSPSSSPFQTPSAAPSTNPSATPTTSAIPTRSPSTEPSLYPSLPPSSFPSGSPSAEPSSEPTNIPSSLPSTLPSSSPPTVDPSLCELAPACNHLAGSCCPTLTGVFLSCCTSSAVPSSSPTFSLEPTFSWAPTQNPSLWTEGPSQQPSLSVTPSSSPSADVNPPTASPSRSTRPSVSPNTNAPSMSPSSRPSLSQRTAPTASPTSRPASLPSVAPSRKPTAHPSQVPSTSPTIALSAVPSSTPTDHPSNTPTVTASPTAAPSPDARAAAFRNLLSPTAPQVTMDALTDSSSPQSQAVQWLVNDPFSNDLSDQRQIQRFALATFSFSTSQATQRTRRHRQLFADQWLTGVEGDECSWKGIFCDSTKSVWAINLAQAGLPGQLPPEWALLKDSLQLLDVSNNNLSGTIPSEYGVLQGLKWLRINGNSLSGQFPSSLGNLKNLLHLQIHMNQLSGPFPNDAIAQMTSLTQARTFFNQFTSDLSDDVCNMGMTILEVDCAQNPTCTFFCF